MEEYKIGFIGGGRITRIILHAFRNRSVGFESIKVFEPDSDTSARLKSQFPYAEICPSNIGPAKQEIVFLAVHPPMVMETLNQVKEVVSADAIIISLAPKITTGKIASVLATKKIARLIPNATSYINKGYNPVSFIETFPEKERKPVLKLIRNLGKTIEVQEEKLEGYAIVSAMLPTYFWFQWKKMEDIALKTGLKPIESRKIIRSTLSRAIKLYYNSGLSYEEVIDLIPVKPIGENEDEIETILDTRLTGLYEKIKP